VVVNETNKRGHLGRNAAIYGGALLLPRLAAFVALIVFSRLLAPAEYGFFALFVTSAELMNAVLFNWIRLAFLRFYAEYQDSGEISVLRRACLSITAVALTLSLPIAAAMSWLVVPERWLAFFGLLVCITLANGVVRLRLSELQAQNRSLPYFGIEIARATLWLAFSLVLILIAGPHFEALGTGFVAANSVVALVCIVPLARDLAHLTVHRALLTAIVTYAGPIVVTAALSSLIPLTERYVIQFVAGPAAVGVYAAAQNLVQQPINMIASSVALAAFPMVMRSADFEGSRAARARLGEVGGLLLALLLPAAAGIFLLRSEIASILLGEQFRAEATILIPWVVVTAILANLKYHYFDLAFHVTRRLLVAVATLLPATLLTAPAIYIFLKLWGLEGAAAGSCLAFVVTLASSWLPGRRLLDLHHAFGEAGRIIVSVGVMAAVLWVMPSMDGPAGLILQIMAGGTAYVMAALAFNIVDSRRFVAASLARLSAKPAGAS
jgi:O-antigen/teichoic acid export membrane protein